VSETLTIQSHAGAYEVAFADVKVSLPPNAHVIVDERVAELHKDRLAEALAAPSCLRITAIEESKFLERMPEYVNHLVAHGIRRDHVLVAIGGGIIQDITCFLSATLLRGVPWQFWPTTLLAQADSCIGSKSSINCGGAKNILGTFTPPRKVTIATGFLDTLDPRELRSGIGEILKVLAIAGPESFDKLARQFDRLPGDRALLLEAIRDALMVKKGYIEEDEFDRGPRLVFNYGHSFGHAIEAATHFAIPHGIAVTLGMDMANFVAWRLGVAGEEPFRRMHPTLRKNYRGFETITVPLDSMMAALAKDKKNTGAGSVTLILPDHEGTIRRGVHAADQRLTDAVRDFLDTECRR
jgi:3-dehydroquinate synthase